jgi:DNA transposition AAA+ family ATPase
MQVAKFSDIKQKLHLQDDESYLYAVEQDGTIKLRRATEYELLAENGLRDVYDDEPDGLWEKCLEN